MMHLAVLKKKLHFIRNGIELSEITSSYYRFCYSYKKGKGKFILGYVGSLIPCKGLDTLFSVLATKANGFVSERYLAMRMAKEYKTLFTEIITSHQ